MRRTATRLVVAAVMLAGALGADRCTPRTAGPGTSGTPTLYPVTINRNSQASPLDTRLSIANGDTVVWVAYAANHPLKITFNHALYPAIANGEPPFEGGTSGADQGYSNAGGTIYSPAVNPKLKDVFQNNPGVTVLYYIYDQAVDGVAKDGRIIIMK